MRVRVRAHVCVRVCERDSVCVCMCVGISFHSCNYLQRETRQDVPRLTFILTLDGVMQKVRRRVIVRVRVGVRVRMRAWVCVCVSFHSCSFFR